MSKEMNKNTKKMIVHITFIIIIMIVVIIGIKEYNLYTYVKNLKQMQMNYNEKQKECVSIGLTPNYIHIFRTDEKNHAIEGSRWKVTTYSGKEMGIITTNKNGNGGLVGLENGEYYLEEVYVPENCTKKDYRYKIVLSDYDNSYTLNVSDAKNSGAILVVLKNEKDEPIENITFNVLDVNNKKVANITTNEKGLAGVINMSDGIYFIKEDKEYAKVHALKIENSSIERIDLIYED